MTVVDVWSGGAASALRTALRMTHDRFAEELGTAVRTVAKWNTDPNLVPVTEMQRALDTMLQRASADARERFAGLMRAANPPVPTHRGIGHAQADVDGLVEQRLAGDVVASQTLAWLDAKTGWPAGTARTRVASEVRQTDAVRHRDRIDARTQVGREAIASTLVEFYRPTNGYIAYSANVERGPVHTSILTRPEWLDLRLPLGRGFDRAILSDGMDVRPLGLEEIGAQAAVHRVAHVLATGGRMANASLYSLRHIGFEDQGISVELGVTDFLSYALTLDLLEAELVDAISAGTPEAHAALPLRQRYLPDLAAVTDLEHRVCSGGPVAVFAAARRRSRSRPDRGDYVFLVQQRSAHTLNANRRLAVIPKAFHQPLIDFSDDAQLSATLEREMEEELFGRADLDGAGAGHRQADPLHLTRLSPPMRALMDHTDAWHVECTGFGLNLVSGNYEFACLIVVEDEDWWGEYGGSIEANWEAEGLQRFSTLDREAVARLVQNESWSNEALFALLQGLRRLADTGGPRVEPPTIALES